MTIVGHDVFGMRASVWGLFGGGAYRLFEQRRWHPQPTPPSACATCARARCGSEGGGAASRARIRCLLNGLGCTQHYNVFLELRVVAHMYSVSLVLLSQVTLLVDGSASFSLCVWVATLQQDTASAKVQLVFPGHQLKATC